MLDLGHQPREMLVQFADGLPDTDPRIKKATTDFRDQIDQAVGALVEPVSHERLSGEEAYQAFQAVSSIVHGLTVTLSTGDGQFQRPARNLLNVMHRRLPSEILDRVCTATTPR